MYFQIWCIITQCNKFYHIYYSLCVCVCVYNNCYNNNYNNSYNNNNNNNCYSIVELETSWEKEICIYVELENFVFFPIWFGIVLNINR